MQTLCGWFPIVFPADRLSNFVVKTLVPLPWICLVPIPWSIFSSCITDFFWFLCHGIFWSLYMDYCGSFTVDSFVSFTMDSLVFFCHGIFWFLDYGFVLVLIHACFWLLYIGSFYSSTISLEALAEGTIHHVTQNSSYTRKQRNNVLLLKTRVYFRV